MSVGGGSRTKRPPLHLPVLCGQRETHARADFKGTPVCSLAPPSLARPCNTACEFADIAHGITESQWGSMDGQFFRLTRQKATLLSRMTR